MKRFLSAFLALVLLHGTALAGLQGVYTNSGVSGGGPSPGGGGAYANFLAIFSTPAQPLTSSVFGYQIAIIGAGAGGSQSTVTLPAVSTCATSGPPSYLYILSVGSAANTLVTQGMDSIFGATPGTGGTQSLELSNYPFFGGGNSNITLVCNTNFGAWIATGGSPSDALSPEEFAFIGFGYNNEFQVQGNYNIANTQVGSLITCDGSSGTVVNLPLISSLPVYNQVQSFQTGLTMHVAATVDGCTLQGIGQTDPLFYAGANHSTLPVAQGDFYDLTIGVNPIGSGAVWLVGGPSAPKLTPVTVAAYTAMGNDTGSTAVPTANTDIKLGSATGVIMDGAAAQGSIGIAIQSGVALSLQSPGTSSGTVLNLYGHAGSGSDKAVINLFGQKDGNSWSYGEDLQGTGNPFYQVYNNTTGQNLFEALGSTNALFVGASKTSFAFPVGIGINPNVAVALSLQAPSGSGVPLTLVGQGGASSNAAAMSFAGQQDGLLWLMGTDILSTGSKDFSIYNVGLTATAFRFDANTDVPYFPSQAQTNVAPAQFGVGGALTAGNVSHMAPAALIFSPISVGTLDNNWSQFTYFANNSTMGIPYASALNMSCIANAKLEIDECGTSGTCAGGTKLWDGTVTSEGTKIPGTIYSTAITAGDTVAIKVVSGTCSAGTFYVSMPYQTN